MLGTVDILLIALYLLGTAALGICARGKQGSAENFFISKGSLPGFLGTTIIGLSITATFFSGISFLAYPSVVLQSGLVIFSGLVTFFLQYFFVVHFFVPRFNRKTWHAPYEILEDRFGAPTRKVTSVLYILMRLGWLAVLIYAPTIAILGATGLGSEYFLPCVVIIGFISTVYSAFGGLRGVMVTDAAQMLVILVGCLITVGFIVYQLPVPVAEAWQRLGETGKLRVWDFSTDLSVGITTWSAMIGSLFATLGMYFGDQMSLQRYMTAGSTENVKKSFLVNMAGVLVILFVLACIGLSLSAWYEFSPTDAKPSDTDKVFLFFVASELPTGVAGLVVAALLAATMSSMTSGVNALSGAIQLDLLPGLLRQRSERQQLILARCLSFGIGIAATGATFYVAQLGQIFDIAQKLLGIFLGPIGVAFIIAVLPLRIARGFIIAGLFCGCFAGILAAFSTQLQSLWPGFPLIAPLWTAPIAMFASALIMLAGVRALENLRGDDND